jgi:hypothetical protein
VPPAVRHDGVGIADATVEDEIRRLTGDELQEARLDACHVKYGGHLRDLELVTAVVLAVPPASLGVVFQIRDEVPAAACW